MPRPLARAFVLFVKELFGHLDKTITANDIDRFCCPDGITTAGANILSCAGRARRRGGIRSAVSARSRDLKPAVFVPVNQNVGQAVFKDEVKERVTGGSMRPPVFVAVLHVQPVGLCRRFEFLIVVGIPPTAILHAVFVVEIMHHFM